MTQRVEKPRKKEVSIHEQHTFDDDYCYECKRSLDSEEHPEDEVPQGNSRWNACYDQWLAYHKRVLEGLKYEINYSDSKMVVKNNWLREFNTRITKAIEEASDER